MRKSGMAAKGELKDELEMPWKEADRPIILRHLPAESEETSKTPLAEIRT
jgi:hypothetical protein